VLFDSSVDLPPGSQLLQDLCSATALTRLCFDDVTYQGEPDLAAVLLALPNLECFGLRNSGQMGHIQVQQSPQQQLLQSSGAIGEQHGHEPSQQLWSAHGDPGDGLKTFTDSSMEFICKLTQLGLLELGSLQGVTAADLADLVEMQDLQGLNLEDLTCDISLSAVPAFSQLTALTGLTLSWASDAPRFEFDPSILAHMTQLEWLELQTCIPAPGTAGAAELPSRLSQLPKLKGLSLDCIEGLREWPAKVFSCLTSSSVLESLTFAALLLDW